MSEIKFYILPTGIGKARINIFEKQLTEKLGARICKAFDAEVTHVVVDDGLDSDKIIKLLELDKSREKSSSSLKVIKSKWLSLCINESKLIDSSDFEVAVTFSKPSNKKLCKDDFKKDDITGRAIDSKEGESNVYEKPEKKKGRWVCMESSKSIDGNHNKHITDELEKLMKTYEQMNEKWRALGYRKAITVLKNHPSEITSYEEAKSLNGVGEKLAEKICEIIDSGQLRKLNELSGLESTKTLELFTKVWGAGPQTAKLWVAQGFKTLQDLTEKAHLTRHQQIGIQYYDELCEKMDRQEVNKIENIVKEVVLSLRPGCEVVVCGSYRRGRDKCGDVDILITHKDGNSHLKLFEELVERLRSSGFITDNLVVANSGDHKKFLGICKLPEKNSKHRRIDLIVVPYCEYFSALLYFTGSGHFNRSMRNLASRKGMSLNEHGLFQGVLRNKGVKVNSGMQLYTPTEESIFEYLGVPYRPSEERDF